MYISSFLLSCLDMCWWRKMGLFLVCFLFQCPLPFWLRPTVDTREEIISICMMQMYSLISLKHILSFNYWKGVTPNVLKNIRRKIYNIFVMPVDMSGGSLEVHSSSKTLALNVEILRCTLQYLGKEQRMAGVVMDTWHYGSIMGTRKWGVRKHQLHCSCAWVISETMISQPKPQK